MFIFLLVSLQHQPKTGGGGAVSPKRQTHVSDIRGTPNMAVFRPVDFSSKPTEQRVPRRRACQVHHRRPAPGADLHCGAARFEWRDVSQPAGGRKLGSGVPFPFAYPRATQKAHGLVLRKTGVKGLAVLGEVCIITNGMGFGCVFCSVCFSSWLPFRTGQQRGALAMLLCWQAWHYVKDCVVEGSPLEDCLRELCFAFSCRCRLTAPQGLKAVQHGARGRWVRMPERPTKWQLVLKQALGHLAARLLDGGVGVRGVVDAAVQAGVSQNGKLPFGPLVGACTRETRRTPESHLRKWTMFRTCQATASAWQWRWALYLFGRNGSSISHVEVVARACSRADEWAITLRFVQEMWDRHQESGLNCGGLSQRTWDN